MQRFRLRIDWFHAANNLYRSFKVGTMLMVNSDSSWVTSDTRRFFKNNEN